MLRLLGNKKLILLLVSIIAFIALMGLTLGNRGELTWPEEFVKDIAGFAQGLIYKPAGAAAGFFENLANMRNVYEENVALKKKLNDYARDAVRLNVLEERVGRLEEALEFSERQKAANNYIWHFAEVVSVNPDAFVHTININAGEKDGIRPEMAVVTTEGLIGIVIETAPFHSTVQLITAIELQAETSKAIAATTRENPDSFGMIENYDRETGLLEMTRIRASDRLKEGDTVITSGYGGVYPRGLVIGRVVSRTVTETGITHKALVKPAVDLDRTKIRQVFVVEMPRPWEEP